MKRILFYLFILSSLLLASPLHAAAESQTWTVRSGDNFEVIANTLQIPIEEIKKYNPGVLENNLQIDQKLKLPLHTYRESKALEQNLAEKTERLGDLERKRADLEGQIASAQAALRWHPVWFWGFWFCVGVIAFIASGAYWIFHQTHPRVFDKPRDRSVRDLRESQMRMRSSFPLEEEGARSRVSPWRPSLKRIPHAR